MKILMVLTSHDQLGNTGKPTGFWLEEFAAPYYDGVDTPLDGIDVPEWWLLQPPERRSVHDGS
ncbi:ThiJ/PfpI family protein [Sinorhizobium alkalisoli]|nr:ThiJ/PfpI family protein [Sinorhizobium alkalisoli]